MLHYYCYGFERRMESGSVAQSILHEGKKHIYANEHSSGHGLGKVSWGSPGPCRDPDSDLQLPG